MVTPEPSLLRLQPLGAHRSQGTARLTIDETIATISHADDGDGDPMLVFESGAVATYGGC